MPHPKVANRPAGLHPLLRERWSPRAFSDRLIDPAAIKRLFQAAQWAMSCFNGQPWRYVYATQDDPAAFERVLATLAPGNQTWASSAPLLAIAIGRTHFEHNSEPNKWSLYDTGAATALLTVQAQAEGLHVHQMGGFDPAKACETLNIPEGYTPISAFAVGYAGDPATLPDALREREAQPGQRKILSEIAFKGLWGQAG
jgi:nitroreductase